MKSKSFVTNYEAYNGYLPTHTTVTKIVTET